MISLLALDLTAIGPVAALVTAVGSTGVGLYVARNARADAREAKASAAKTESSRQTFEEKSLAITTLEKAVDAMGEMVDRATARAEACEKREARLQDRINKLEQVTGLA